MKKIILGTILTTLFIGGCSTMDTTNNAENLIGTEFIMVKNNKKQNITLGFNKDNYFGFSGVNNYFGKYKIDGKNIKFDKMGATMMAGPIPDMKIEREYFDKLVTVVSYDLNNDKLTLKTSTGELIHYIKKEQNS